MDELNTFMNVLEHLLAVDRDDDKLLAQARQAGTLKILEIKSSYRNLAYSTEAMKESTAEAKVHLDESSLQLQNLEYEANHYGKEISSCRDFKSAYSDEKVELVPIDEFRADPIVQEQGLAVDDPHQLMLNRLQQELMSRERKLGELEMLKARREALAADVAQKRSTVSALESEVGRLLSAARKVQQLYGIPALGPLGSSESQAAMQLPLPLYILYSQLVLAAELRSGSNGAHRVSVGIEGGQPQAVKATAKSVALSAAAAVALSIVGTDGSPALRVLFSYAPQLGLVTVAGGNPAQDEALSSLFEGEGEEMVAPSTSSGDEGGIPGKAYM